MSIDPWIPCSNEPEFFNTPKCNLGLPHVVPLFVCLVGSRTPEALHGTWHRLTKGGAYATRRLYACKGRQTRPFSWAGYIPTPPLVGRQGNSRFRARSRGPQNGGLHVRARTELGVFMAACSAARAEGVGLFVWCRGAFAGYLIFVCGSELWTAASESEKRAAGNELFKVSIAEGRLEEEAVG